MTKATRPTGEVNRQSLGVAFAATIGLMTSAPSIVSAPLGLFIVPISEALGIGRGTFGLMTGAAMLLGAALTPMAGQAMDRYGVRRLVLPGLVGLVAVELLLAFSPASIALFAILLLLQGAVSCLLTPLAYAKVIALWFHRRRGIMLGVASAIGTGAGSGVSALLVGLAIAMGGWRYGYLAMGLYLLLVGGPVLFLLLREPAVSLPSDDTPSVELPGLSRGEALASPAFRLILVMVVASLGAITIMMIHGPALLAARGLMIGPAFLGAAAIGSMTGQLLSGLLLDRIDSPRVGLVFALAALIGGLVILHLGTSAAIVLPAAAVMGLGQGAEVGLASYYVSRFCGLRAYASVFSIVVALVTLSAGLFPMIAGFVFDTTGGYDALIPLIDLLLVLAPLAILLMPRYRFVARPMTG